MNSSRRIVRASAVVTVLSLAALGAGFLLQVFMAARFGAAADTDAYLAATTLPNLINAVFLTAMNITFIPVFIEYETRESEAAAWRVALTFIVLVTGLMVALAGVASRFSAPLISLIAPGLSRSPSTLRLAAELQLWLLPAMVLMALAGLLGGLFYARQAFVTPTLAPFIGNLTAVGLAWLLADSQGIRAVALGVLGGTTLQTLFLLWRLRVRFQVRPVFAWRHPGVRQIGRLMFPWLLGAMIYKANPVVDRLVASRFPEGSISILGYAFMLIQVAVFAASKGASLAVFPALSRLVSAGRRQELPEVIDTGLRLVILALAPLMVLVLFLGEEVVALVFQRGEFSVASGLLTARAIVAYSGALVALSLGNVLGYVYYALQDTRTPAVVGSLGMGLNLALALALSRRVGFMAPALSFSAMSVVNLIVLAFLLRRRLDRLVQPGFAHYCGAMGLAGLGMAAAVGLAGRLPAATTLPGGLAAVGPLLIPSAAGLLVFLTLVMVFHRRFVLDLLSETRLRWRTAAGESG